MTVVSKELKERLRLHEATPASELLRKNIEEAVAKTHVNALLFSGRIDSTALAAFDRKTPVYTAGLIGESEDLIFGEQTAKEMGLSWRNAGFTRAAALTSLREVARIRESYDPTLKDDLVFYMAARKAMDDGATVIRVGDYADELFLGYGPMQVQGFRTVRAYIDKRFPQIPLTSTQMEERMGVTIDYPYKDDSIVDLARSLRREDNLAKAAEYGNAYQKLVEEKTGRKQKEYMWAKITLRKAMFGILPEDVVYRPKAALEVGGGTYKLDEDLAKMIDPNKLTKNELEKLRFFDAAHLALYIMFKEAGFNIKPLQKGEKGYECTWCGAGITTGNGHYCPTCGAYPAHNNETGISALSLLNR